MDAKSAMADSRSRHIQPLRAWWFGLSRSDHRRFGRFLVWTVAVTAVFVHPLIALMIHAAESKLDSYIPLGPVIAGYLLYIRRSSLPSADGTSVTGAAIAIGFAVVALVARVVFRESLNLTDGLALTTVAYVTALAAGGFLLLGSSWMSAAMFPFAFLIFLVPLPSAAVERIEMASVAASAEVAASLFKFTGTPLLRDGTIFVLPTTVLQVAQECSGIRSSLVLFITSLVISNVFLRNSWRRVALVLFVIPLGIVRNGFRILVIGLLSVHIGPQMIDSVIHRRGGPLFFALSLVPLFLFLRWLWRQEQQRA